MTLNLGNYLEIFPHKFGNCLASILDLQLFVLKLLTIYILSCFRLKAEFQRYQSYNYNDYYQDYQNYYSQWNYDPYADYNYSSYTPYDSMQTVGDCSLGDAVMAPAVFEVKILRS